MRPLSGSQKRSLASASLTFASSLAGSPAESYLASRGFDPVFVARHQLGWVPPGVSGFEQYAGRLSIPNRSLGGIVGIKFRLIDDDDTGPKYLGIDGIPARLFNLAALATPSPFIVVTEGELDAICIEQMGMPAVAVPGASNWKSHHERILENYEEVILVRDNDQAGGLLAKKLIAETELPIRVVNPPFGNDVNESVINGHGDALAALIRGEAS